MQKPVYYNPKTHARTDKPKKGFEKVLVSEFYHEALLKNKNLLLDYPLYEKSRQVSVQDKTNTLYAPAGLILNSANGELTLHAKGGKRFVIKAKEITAD